MLFAHRSVVLARIITVIALTTAANAAMATETVVIHSTLFNCNPAEYSINVGAERVSRPAAMCDLVGGEDRGANQQNAISPFNSSKTWSK